MEGKAFEEAVEGVRASGGEVRAEAIAADVFELVFIGEWRDGALGVFI